MSYSLLRRLLFLLSPETSHHMALMAISGMHKLGLSHLLASGAETGRSCKVMGIEFPNRLGMAAGLDKNADYLDGLGSLGFGFLEVGTVTPRPQPGNPRPRLFRLPGKQAIINRMGFNNKGLEHLLHQVEQSHYKGILGINIGKNFDTPVETALDDYLLGLQRAYSLADYISVNLSSPNTPGLRKLQFGDELKGLLEGLKKEQINCSESYGKYKPIVIKIAPDMSTEELQEVAGIFLNFEVDGVIATNTTVSREGLDGEKHAGETGGLSGTPLCDKSTAVVAQLNECLAGKIPIIAVGGISSAADAIEKIQAGASLVQIYTGFIYQGPALIKAIIAALNEKTGK